MQPTPQIPAPANWPPIRHPVDAKKLARDFAEMHPADQAELIAPTIPCDEDWLVDTVAQCSDELIAAIGFERPDVIGAVILAAWKADQLRTAYYRQACEPAPARYPTGTAAARALFDKLMPGVL